MIQPGMANLTHHSEQAPCCPPHCAGRTTRWSLWARQICDAPKLCRPGGVGLGLILCQWCRPRCRVANTSCPSTASSLQPWGSPCRWSVHVLPRPEPGILADLSGEGQASQTLQHPRPLENLAASKPRSPRLPIHLRYLSLKHAGREELSSCRGAAVELLWSCCTAAVQLWICWGPAGGLRWNCCGAFGALQLELLCASCGAALEPQASCCGAGVAAVVAAPVEQLRSRCGAAVGLSWPLLWPLLWGCCRTLVEQLGTCWSAEVDLKRSLG